MSVKINLLPDIRQAKIRARHTRQLAFAIASLICAVSVGAIVLLLVITTAQTLQIKALNNKIADRQAELNSKDDLQKIVTLQQHLDSLPALYSGRPTMVKFFKTVEKITPAEIAFTSVDYTDLSLLKASGKARSMGSVDKLVKAMNASKDESGNPYYTDVNVMTESLDAVSGITFDLTATVSPEASNGK